MEKNVLSERLTYEIGPRRTFQWTPQLRCQGMPLVQVTNPLHEDQVDVLAMEPFLWWWRMLKTHVSMAEKQAQDLHHAVYLHINDHMRKGNDLLFNVHTDGSIYMYRLKNNYHTQAFDVDIYSGVSGGYLYMSKKEFHDLLSHIDENYPPPVAVLF